MESTSRPASADGEGIRFRSARFPLLVIDFIHAVSDTVFDEFLDTVTLFTRKREPMAVVVNADGIGSMTPAQIDKLIAWLRLNEVGLKNYVLGMSFVVTSDNVRNMLRPVLINFKTRSDVFLASFEDEGIAFAEESLASAGIELPLEFGAE